MLARTVRLPILLGIGREQFVLAGKITFNSL